jgi:ribosome-binding factor A
LRVGEAVRHALSEFLGRRELRDPALEDRSITVTEVRVSPDMRNATAFVSVLGGDDTDAVLEGLGRAAPHINAQVAGMVRLKRSPKLSFVADTAFDQARHISDIFNDPDVARDLADTDTDTDTDSDDGDDV